MEISTKSKELLLELDKMGINTSEELVDYLPYKYEFLNYSNENEIQNKDRIIILGKLVSNPVIFNNGKISIITFHFVSVDDKFYTCKIFNRPFFMNILDLENQFTIIGTIDLEKRIINVINLKKGIIPPSERIKANYHLPTSINLTNYSKLVKKNLELNKLYYKDLFPNYLKNKYKILNHIDALMLVHFPENKNDISIGLRSLKFEECMKYCLINKIIKEENKKIKKPFSQDFNVKLINEFILKLPYKLTQDQIIAIREIVTDIKSDKVMYRLLQGDVGTGKTIVSIVCLYANYLKGKQGLILVPTESLARQHYLNVSSLLEPYGIKVGLLIGDMKEKEKSELKDKIANNEIDIVIGTHILFSKKTIYSNVGLAIIDEQHRFGVNQRNALFLKGNDVDMLLMSATPIPQTLAMTIYGDLDVSTLTNYPNGKHHVITKVVDYSSNKILNLINYCLENRRQVFIVCPKISLGTFYQSSEQIYNQFEPIFKEKISLLHGKMSGEEKNTILTKFKNNEISIIVSTTLVELGIDIKTAGGMIIYCANSFGLASLHQLRGRVGRDGQDAYCLLVDHFEEGEDSSRLKFLETCDDGFEISNEDMKRRGPGDFIGINQSGFPSFSALNIVDDFNMFTYARKEADFIYLNLDNPSLKEYYDYISSQIDKYNQ